jgi:hypothetical protein
MKAYMEAAAEWMRHNYATVLAVLVAAMICCYGYGCDSKVAGIVNPAEKVTRAQLQVEVKQQAAKIDRTLAEKVTSIQTRQQQLQAELQSAKADHAADANSLAMLNQVRLADLDKQDAARAAVLDFGLNVLQQSTGAGPGAAVTGLVAVLAGVLVDNRRKDGIINGQRINTPTQPTA